MYRRWRSVRLNWLCPAEHLLDDALAHALALCTGHHVWSHVTNVASAAQDSDAVANGQGFSKLVSDEHNGDALVAQAAQEFEQRRHFAWRKKWARDWPSVVYCSRRCRSAARG